MMGRRVAKQLSLLHLVALCAIGLACHAGEADRIRVAVVPFGAAKGGSAPPVDVAEVIRADLASSGRFASMDAAEMPSHPTALGDVRYEDWRRANADYVVIGFVARVHDGGHEVEFRLLDTRTRTTLVGFLVPSAPDALEQTGREIAKMVDQRLSAS
jgi:TolB protein